MWKLGDAPINRRTFIQQRLIRQFDVALLQLIRQQVTEIKFKNLFPVLLLNLLFFVTCQYTFKQVAVHEKIVNGAPPFCSI